MLGKHVNGRYEKKEASSRSRSQLAHRKKDLRKGEKKEYPRWVEFETGESAISEKKGWSNLPTGVVLSLGERGCDCSCPQLGGGKHSYNSKKNRSRETSAL